MQSKKRRHVVSMETIFCTQVQYKSKKKFQCNVEYGFKLKKSNRKFGYKNLEII